MILIAQCPPHSIIWGSSEPVNRCSLLCIRNLPLWFPICQRKVNPWNHFGTYDPNPIPRSEFDGHDLLFSNHCICMERFGLININNVRVDCGNCCVSMIKREGKKREDSQCKCFVPNWIQWCFDCFRFLLHIIRIWHKLKFNVRITQTIRIHWNKISSLFHCNDIKREMENSQLRNIWFVFSKRNFRQSRILITAE